MIPVRYDQHGFQPAQHAIGAPVFGELDRGATQLATVAFEHAFETFQQGKCIGRGAGKSRDDLVVVDLAHLGGIALHHRVTQRDLAITADNDRAVTSHGHYGCAVKCLHLLLHDVGLAESQPGG